MKKQISLKFNNEKNVNYIDVTDVQLENKELKVISLFSGCGGMDLGIEGGFDIFGNHYEKNPFNIVFANDFDRYACQTYSENFNIDAVHDDIKNLDFSDDTYKKIDVVVGGFPCQDFSHAGNRKGTNSERGRLYKSMKKIVEQVKPKAFIAENVDGLRTMKNENSSTLDLIISEFEEIGYDVVYRVLNAADYGVPQARIRVIIMGYRKDLNVKIFYPKPTHGEKSQKHPWLTAKDAIDDLWDKLERGHINKHSKKDYSKAKFYPNRKMQGNRKIEADEPSITIRAEHHGNIEAHYRTYLPEDPDNMAGWRRLSVRECARLQSFPDNFTFSCSTSQAYRQVGNAVPPILGWHVARALHYTLSYQ